MRNDQKNPTEENSMIAVRRAVYSNSKMRARRMLMALVACWPNKADEGKINKYNARYPLMPSPAP
jgi:hypothetical protein